MLDSLTGFYDFLSRNYDPVLGRFPQVDPAGQFSSPYTGMGNNPHQVIDPNGEWGFFINLLANAAWNAAGAAGQAAVNSWNGNGSFSENFSAQGFSTGFSYNTGSGYGLNPTNGYGGFTTPEGGKSEIWSGLPEEVESVFYELIWVDPDDAEWIPSDGEENAGGIMASRSYYYLVEGDGLPGSGVSEDSFWRYIPVASSLIGVADAAYEGNYGGAVFNGAMAASDIFLAKSIAKGIAKGGLKMLTKNYKYWTSWRGAYGKTGFAKSGQQLHHWAWARNGAVKGQGFSWWAKNQMWNLKPMLNQAQHTGVHHHFGPLKTFWFGTPTWFKAGTISGGGRIGEKIFN
ncbi:MAG: hypothetical protein HRT61_20550 [Ekhidna sp.]|nr:hypothetical protein [Ekhidna sp.]